MVMSAGINAQPKNDDKESARVFVQKFYDWYNDLYNAETPEKKPSQFLLKNSRIKQKSRNLLMNRYEGNYR